MYLGSAIVGVFCLIKKGEGEIARISKGKTVA